MKPIKVLIVVDWYLPGYKGGGPIKSIYALIHLLKDNFIYYILTSDRDLGDSNPHSGVSINQWTKLSNQINIYYLAQKSSLLQVIKNSLRDISPDKIYINSMFSTRFGILPLIYSSFIFDPHKIILAPRGMLQEGALSKKKLKKLIYLRALSLSGIATGISFHATDQTELLDINKYFNKKKTVFKIPNLPGQIDEQINSVFKEPNQLAIIFISRIEHKKNLFFLLKLLSEFIDLKVKLNIFGFVVEDPYYRECQILATSFPKNITVQWNDAISFEFVKSKLIDHHLFILPTLGENYGHAIIEALSVGRPVLISDQTPWKNLHEYHAGWELPLSDKQAWIKAIEEAASWDQAEFDKHCLGALVYARAHTKVEELVEKYREMFGG